MNYGQRAASGSRYSPAPTRPEFYAFRIIALLVSALGILGAGAQTRFVGIVAGPILYPTNQHQYYLLEPASWTDAEATAVAMKGHLATINDQEEHTWVRDTFSGYGGLDRALWIGLIDPDPSVTRTNGNNVWINHFVWASGYPVSFFCWSTLQQSSAGVGRVKMLRPEPTWPWGQAEWGEEADSTLLNGVVEVPLPLEIVSRPKDRAAGVDSNATFSVFADGTSPISYQWQFMGSNLLGATKASLEIAHVRPDQFGPYTVVLSNLSGSLTSAPATLSLAVGTTNRPPVLPPIQGKYAIDELTELVVTNSVTDGGSPAGPVQYRLDQAPEGASIDPAGIFRWVPSEFQGPCTNTVVVSAMNLVSGLQAQNIFVVTVREVNSPPALPSQPDIVLNALSTIVVTNTAAHFDWPFGGLDYQLIDPPFGATIDPVGVIRWTPTPAQFPSTNVFTTVVTDYGTPRLSATNTFRVVLTSRNDGVVRIISQPQNVSVGIGRDIMLSVVADGLQPIGYQWRFMGTNIAGAVAPVLVLSNAQPDQSGAYDVVVSNQGGSLASQTAWVAVQGVVAWGWSSYQLLEAPVTVTNVIALSCGKLHSLALRADGTVIAWGGGSSDVTNVPPGLEQVAAVSAGNGYSLALRRDGTVVGWGTSIKGDLTIPTDLTNVVAVSAGSGANLALKSDGTVVGWGSPEYPGLKVPPDLSNVVAVATVSENSLALQADGNLIAWGRYIPVKGGGFYPPAYVPKGLSNVVAIAVEFSHSEALLANGTVAAWGADSAGVFRVPPGLTNIVAISTCNSHSLALRNDGTVCQWGYLYGDVLQPIDLRNVVAIATGGYMSVALLRDGAPQMTVQPNDQTVQSGAQSRFVAKAVGQQSMTYQWQFNGVDIPGATSDAYSISSATAADAGTYALRVVNPLGTTVSRPAKLALAGLQPSVIKLTMLPMVNGQFGFLINGAPGREYRIETSTNFVNWLLARTISPISMPAEFRDKQVNPSGTRFYRVSWQP